MKISQLKFEAPLRVSFETVEAKEALKADEALVANEYTIVSVGTEVANLKRMPNTVTASSGFPFFPGYSGVGRIVGLGESASSLRLGDRVIVAWGGHRSHSVVKAAALVKVEDAAVDAIEAAFAHIASFSFLGVRKLGLELGESAMVAGVGLLGAFAVQIAALSGAVPVLAVDYSPERRALAARLGAEAAFDPCDNLVEAVLAATDRRGVDAVVEVTGQAEALKQALEYVAWEGRVSLLGCTRVSDIPIDFYKYVHKRGVSLIGSHTYARPKMESAPGRRTERDDHRTFLKLLAAGRLKVAPLISEVVSPARGAEVFDRLVRMDNPPLGVVFDWGRV